MVGKTRNWRLQADCLEKFSCLANCISPLIVQQKFIPLLFERIKLVRTLPCKIASARTLLVILRFTVKGEDRIKILGRIKEELALAKSCHIRMLYLKLCDMSISLFSKDYFKRNFFVDFLHLASDPVVNVRLKICSMLPRIKSLICLPSDRSLLDMLEETVKNLLLRETDTDVLHSVQVSKKLKKSKIYIYIYIHNIRVGLMLKLMLIHTMSFHLGTDTRARKYGNGS